ncbi:hypothetical protein FHW20_002155 [Ochrobactrum intermedium]|uniref:Uncharacterized protein n=1 Tax=Brucella intermedia TaxID=94625 RepID=A0ABR6AP39_9HYPH|nr:hypothetical protein [Brucella intermedia]MBA8851220.1 hypothetical protein [Brucella intermedia]WPM82781.1 hypothetical protein R5W60_16705 [Brucella pseudintermedia]
MDLKLQPSDYIAGVSAIGAALAACFAWMSAKQSKRQADAVLGDVEPSFGAYQNPPDEYSEQASLSIEIVNHNKRPLLIEELSFEYPPSVIIFSDSETLRGVIESIFDAMKDGPRIKRFEIPLRLRGRGTNEQSSLLTIPMRCSWKIGEERAPINFYVRVRYRQEGDRDTEDAYIGVQILPPKII